MLSLFLSVAYSGGDSWFEAAAERVTTSWAADIGRIVDVSGGALYSLRWVEQDGR